jgi:hypothetical protein
MAPVARASRPRADAHGRVAQCLGDRARTDQRVGSHGDGNPYTDSRTVSSVPLSPGEMWGPLLQEGPHAFLMVRGLPCEMLRAGGLRQVFGEVLLLGFMHEHLD